MPSYTLTNLYNVSDLLPSENEAKNVQKRIQHFQAVVTQRGDKNKTCFHLFSFASAYFQMFTYETFLEFNKTIELNLLEMWPSDSSVYYVLFNVVY